jgi:transposase-like protein
VQKYRQDEKAKVIGAYKAGNSDRKISQMYGIPKSTVRLWCKNYEVFGEEIYKEKKNYKKWSNEIKVTAVREYLDGYGERLAEFVKKVDNLKNNLVNYGYVLYGNEAIKITVCTKKIGYYGYDFAKKLQEQGMVCEFSDPDFVTLMLTPENENNLKQIENILLSIEKRGEIFESSPKFSQTKRAMSLREAGLSPYETVSAEESVGRVASLSTVGCPPAVPIVIGGELIDENAVNCFKYYGINKINVVK